MSDEEAAEFARGLAGPFAAISHNPHGLYPYAVVIVNAGMLRALGNGDSWEEACDEAIEWVDGAARENVGVFEPQELPF